MLNLWLVLALQDPTGWTLEKEVDHGGSPFRSIDATIITRWYKRAGIHARVTIITFADEEEAKKREGERVVRRGSVCYEFLGLSPAIQKRLCQDMGLSKGAVAEYEVALKVACVDSLDYMNANRVTNLLIAGKDVAELTRGWTFGRSVRMLGEWTFSPEPSTRADEGGVTRYTFEKPAFDRVPSVEAKATIRVRDWYTPSGQAVEGLTKATAFWPVERLQRTPAQSTFEAPLPVS